MNPNPASRVATPGPESGPRPLNYHDIALTLATRVRLLIAVPLIAGMVAAIVSLVTPPRYTANVALLAESRTPGVSEQLAGLAALAGVSVGAGGATQSPQFYTALLRSRAIQYAVLQRKFGTAEFGALVSQDTATLLDLLSIRGKTPALRLAYGAKRLARETTVAADVKTGIIRLSYTAKSPHLAAAVANAYAEELNRFNRDTRQFQARARRRFVEERVDATARDLGAAEAGMRDFLSRNRQYQDSPPLLFEYQRLQRAVGLQQELYLDLRRQLDAARIAEVDDTPTLTTIESAIPPQMKSWPSRKRWVATTVLAIFAILATLVVLAEHRAVLMPGPLEVYRTAVARLRGRTRSAT